jgi:hypothetical protein
MFKHQLGLCALVALLLALCAGSSVAQQVSPTPAAQPGTQCGGQYECVEDRPMTPAESQASRSHPHNAAQQNPKQVATAEPTAGKSEADDKREGTSGP